MKKLLTLALAAAMMAGAAQFALAAEDDGASSIMAQINSFKATNQEKTGGAVSEDKAETQAPAAAEESEAPEQAQPSPQAHVAPYLRIFQHHRRLLSLVLFHARQR